MVRACSLSPRSTHLTSSFTEGVDQSCSSSQTGWHQLSDWYHGYLVSVPKYLSTSVLHHQTIISPDTISRRPTRSVLPELECELECESQSDTSSQPVTGHQLQLLLSSTWATASRGIDDGTGKGPTAAGRKGGWTRRRPSKVAHHHQKLPPNPCSPVLSPNLQHPPIQLDGAAARPGPRAQLVEPCPTVPVGSSIRHFWAGIRVHSTPSWRLNRALGIAGRSRGVEYGIPR